MLMYVVGHENVTVRDAADDLQISPGAAQNRLLRLKKQGRIDRTPFKYSPTSPKPCYAYNPTEAGIKKAQYIERKRDKKTWMNP